jgi:hypothetical protein
MTTHSNISSGHHPGALHELALATASLLGDQDVIGMTTSLLSGCVRATGAAAAGLVVTRPDDQHLELLASTSHRVQELELYQLQVDEGPCVEAVKTLAPVTVIGPQEIAIRWPAVTAAFERAGYLAVHAAPMVWRGKALGAVNLFFTTTGSVADSTEVAQAFADMATIALVHSGRLTAQDVVGRAKAALDDRIVVERAKGVLAYTKNVPPDEAFDLLLALAAAAAQPLGEVATQVIENAINAD